MKKTLWKNNLNFVKDVTMINVNLIIIDIKVLWKKILKLKATFTNKTLQKCKNMVTKKSEIKSLLGERNVQQLLVLKNA